MVVLHVFRASECDGGDWVAQKWQFRRDVIIEQSYMQNNNLRPVSNQTTAPIRPRWPEADTCVEGDYRPVE